MTGICSLGNLSTHLRNRTGRGLRSDWRASAWVSCCLAVATGFVAGCGDEQQEADTESEQVTEAKEAKAKRIETPMPPANGPQLVSTSLATMVYAQPSTESEKLGYLRVGEKVARSVEAVSYEGCEHGWYRVRPVGYVCVGDRASLYLQHPIARALGKLPDLSKPLPYRYAFVRSISPNYLRVPTKQEQEKYEFKLARHLRSYAKLEDQWQALEVGANDVPLNAEGVAIGEPPSAPPQLSMNERFGGSGQEMVPWWLDGGRKIPHLASYKAPRYAVIAGRVKRFTGVAVIDSFVPGDAAGQRRMAVTADGRLIPVSKLKPNTGSTWHGVAVGKQTGISLPAGFIRHRQGADVFGNNTADEQSAGKLPFRSLVQLNGKVRNRGEKRQLQRTDGTWINSDDAAIAALPSKLPFFAKGKQKWIEISLNNQVMIAWEGSTPVYITLVSTGKGGLGDPKTTHASPQGTFWIREKHVTTTMDSDDVGNEFELRDVPWVQYFHHGYALHAAYWHDDYGRIRSHGCINMSPIDARWFFFWTTPGLPEGWHGVWQSEATAKGTIVHIHP